MKRWLSFLLMLIVLTGMFFPCCLVDECNDEETATAQNENKPKQEGTCSPFFACATCPGFTAMAKPVQIIQRVKENQVHHEAIVIFNLTTFPSSFWQPPRSC